MPYNSFVRSFVETKLFTRLVQQYLTEDEYATLQTFLSNHPGERRRYPWVRQIRKEIEDD